MGSLIGCRLSQGFGLDPSQFIFVGNATIQSHCGTYCSFPRNADVKIELIAEQVPFCTLIETMRSTRTLIVHCCAHVQQRECTHSPAYGPYKTLLDLVQSCFSACLTCVYS
jgi:hypothetical protein